MQIPMSSSFVDQIQRRQKKKLQPQPQLVRGRNALTTVTIGFQTDQSLGIQVSRPLAVATMGGLMFITKYQTLALRAGSQGIFLRLINPLKDLSFVSRLKSQEVSCRIRSVIRLCNGVSGPPKRKRYLFGPDEWQPGLFSQEWSKMAPKAHPPKVSSLGRDSCHVSQCPARAWRVIGPS